jgi:hypothetical protein
MMTYCGVPSVPATLETAIPGSMAAQELLVKRNPKIQIGDRSRNSDSLFIFR